MRERNGEKCCTGVEPVGMSVNVQGCGWWMCEGPNLKWPASVPWLGGGRCIGWEGCLLGGPLVRACLGGGVSSEGAADGTEVWTAGTGPSGMVGQGLVEDGAGVRGAGWETMEW